MWSWRICLSSSGSCPWTLALIGTKWSCTVSGHHKKCPMAITSKGGVWEGCSCFSPNPHFYCNGWKQHQWITQLLEHNHHFSIYQATSFRVKGCWHHRLRSLPILLWPRLVLLVDVAVRTVFCSRTPESVCLTCHANLPVLTGWIAAFASFSACLFIPGLWDVAANITGSVIALTKQFSRDGSEVVWFFFVFFFIEIIYSSLVCIFSAVINLVSITQMGILGADYVFVLI